MAPLTIYLGKLIGSYCVIVALVMLARRRGMIAAVTALVDSPPLMLLTGVFTLMIGLALALGHNVWSGGALPVLVTLIGWLSAIKGAAILAMAPGGGARLLAVIHYEKLYFVFMAATLVLGVYMLTVAFGA